MGTGTAEFNASILQRIAAGDKSAVDDCLAQYGGLVWSLTRRYCSATEEAEDAVQEIFIDLWQSAHRFDPVKSTETTFVALIARRRLIDRLRKNASQLPADESGTTEVHATEVDVTTQAELVEDAAQAQKCLSKLKAEEKSVIEMTVCSGHSQARASEKLQLPLGTVKSHARRGLIKLRDCMRAAGFGLVTGGVR